MNRSLFIATFLLLLCLPVQALAGDAGHPERVVYHLDDSSNARWAMTLANAHLKQNAKAQIVIVAHGPGIRFLIEGAEDGNGNLYEPDVFGLAGKGVEFKACAATLDFMDIPPEKVLEEAKMVPSGAYEIVRLQTHEGYAYLKP